MGPLLLLVVINRNLASRPVIILFSTCDDFKDKNRRKLGTAHTSDSGKATPQYADHVIRIIIRIRAIRLGSLPEVTPRIPVQTAIHAGISRNSWFVITVVDKKTQPASCPTPLANASDRRRD